MKKWIFTFGSGHRLGGYCQPIYAGSMLEAREKMAELHGLDWAFQYSGDEWEGFKKDPNRFWSMEKELNSIYCKGVE